MTPTDFPQSNKDFGAPEDCDSSQVQTIRACLAEKTGGNMDGSALVIVAWKPSDAEIQDILNGEPVFLTCVGGLPPHYLSTSFQEATLPRS